MPRTTTLRELAIEAGLDLDEALVSVWDAGLDQFDDIDDRVPAGAVGSVRKVLGLTNPKEMQHLAFWEREWSLDRGELARRLSDDFGIHISKNARVLPKGALKRLRGLTLAGAVRATGEPAIMHLSTADDGVFAWSPPGHCRAVAPLTVEEVCQVHEALVDDFMSSGDPISPAGVRDENLLRSAVSRPDTSIGDVLKYSTVEVYAGALMHSLVHNHPFYNGNKRTALVSVLVLLDRNNFLLTCSEQDLFKLVLRVAQHRIVPSAKRQMSDREVIAIADWICLNCRPIQRGERPLQWRELRKVLTQLSCTVSSPVPGNKVRVERLATSRILGISRTRRLRVTAGYRNEGMEVDVSSLNHIRRELHLDEQHGYDSEYFYGKDSQRPDEFIGQYRTLLKRLGRL